MTAISITDLSTILSLVGATGSTAICYILPGILYYKMKRMGRSVDDRNWDMSEFSALALSAFGVIVMVVCVVAQFVAIHNGNTVGPHR